MSPREKVTTLSSDSFSTGDTIVLQTPDGAPFVVCNSNKPFVNPTTPEDATPEEINRQLNLDLGQRVITRRNATLLWIIDFLDKSLFQWWEKVFFNFWSEVVPLTFRRFITHVAWKFYFRIHKAFLGKRTGLHPAQSYEYHAITTVMWWARFIAVTPQRMRFSLSQLYVIAPNDPPTPDRTTHIHEFPNFLRDDAVPPDQKDASTVKGLYIHRHNKQQPTEKIIFWIYGGAYLAGDARGNSSSADWIGTRCDMDVFIPQIRLAPEANIDDVLWDTCLAYKWISSRVDNPSEQILVLGISSGGALAMRLMQISAQHSRKEPIWGPRVLWQST